MLDELKRALVKAWFAKGGAEASGIRPTAGTVLDGENDVAARQLAPFVRQAEREYGALAQDLSLTRGLSGEMLPKARQALGGVLAERLLGGNGPSGWALWNDRDLRAGVVSSVVDGLASGLPVSDVVRDVSGSLAKIGISQSSLSGLARLPATRDVPVAGSGTASGLGSFGPVAFQVSSDEVFTVRDLARKRPARVAVHEVLSRPCKLQFLGVGPWELSFRIHLHPGFCSDPLARIADLERIQAEGEHHAFVLGGRNLGRFLLTEIEETDRFLGKGGRLAGARLDITLKEYA